MPPPQVGPPEPPGAVLPQQKRQRTGRRPASLRGPKIDHGSTPGAHPMPTLCPAPTRSVPTAWWSPCLLLPGSQSPNARLPNGSSVFPRRLPRTERPQLWELRRFAVPRAAPAAESEVASSSRPRRQRLELVPAASALAARARLVR